MRNKYPNAPVLFWPAADYEVAADISDGRAGRSYERPSTFDNINGFHRLSTCQTEFSHFKKVGFQPEQPAEITCSNIFTCFSDNVNTCWAQLFLAGVPTAWHGHCQSANQLTSLTHKWGERAAGDSGFIYCIDLPNLTEVLTEFWVLSQFASWVNYVLMHHLISIWALFLIKNETKTIHYTIEENMKILCASKTHLKDKHTFTPNTNTWLASSYSCNDVSRNLKLTEYPLLSV